MPIWEKAKIPTRQEYHVITEIKSLHAKWTNLKKSKNRKSATQESNEKAYLSTMDDLFDVAHADALKLIQIPEDREFLLAQREKGNSYLIIGCSICFL